MNFDEIKSVIVSSAEKNGVAEYEIFYTENESLSAETVKNEISSFSSEHTASVNFRCTVGGKMGYAYTELLEPEELAGLVTRAADNAAVTECEDEVEIFRGSDEYLPADMPEPSLPDAASVREIALKLQEKTYSLSDKVSDGTQSVAGSGITATRMYNSYGLDLSERYGIDYAYSEAVVRDGEDTAYSFRGGNGRSYAELAYNSEKAVEEALSRLGAVPAETGSYPVIISANTMRSILATFASVFSAQNAQKGLSLLAGKEGQKIASDIITIADDPFREGSVMTAFDGEGVATRTKNVIEKGVLTTLLHNLSSGKKAGVPSTGNGNHSNGIRFHNFYILPGDNTLDELLKAADGGIYVTEVKGLHAGADATTGDFSVESAGHMIENGKIGHPVKSFTIAGNFFTLLKDISALSDTVDFGVVTSATAFGSPDVFIPSISVAGK